MKHFLIMISIWSSPTYWVAKGASTIANRKKNRSLAATAQIVGKCHKVNNEWSRSPRLCILSGRVMWIIPCHKPPMWEWFIPPIKKKVMTTGWFVTWFYPHDTQSWTIPLTNMILNVDLINGNTPSWTIITF